MEVSRRRLNTYGKATRKVLVHDLFNVKSGHGNLYEPVAPSTDRPARTRTSTPLSDFSEDPETSQQLNCELQASVGRSREPSAAASAKASTLISSRETSPGVFDLDSSDFEMPASKRPATTYKRRKVVGNPSSQKEHPKKMRVSPSTSQDNVSVKLPESTSTLERNKVAENVFLRSADDLSMIKSKSTVNDRHVRGMKTSSKHSPSSILKAPRSPHSIGSPDSEKSTGSMVSSRSTPKRKREIADDVGSDLSSPSHLELSSLRLTPGRRMENNAKSIDLEQSDSSMKSPSRRRRRIIDRLDSPRTSSKTKEVKNTDVSPRPEKSRNVTPDLVAPSLASQNSASITGAPESRTSIDDRGQFENAGPRVRTYGKQRSHLKSTVSGIENQSQTSSQGSIHQMLSQIDSLSTTIKDQYQIEIEDDDPSMRLKTIHELRQAGEVNRADRDLEAAFEDIHSGNKTVRIQALMQLTGKLQKQAFRRLLLESDKLPRLTSLSQPDLDLTTTSVLLLALRALANSETATAQALSQIYRGILSLPPRVLSETRSISRIARDRTENLSKSIVHDLMEFESRIVDQSHSAGRQATKSIIVSRLALMTLELLPQRLRDLAEPVPEPSSSFLEAVVRTTKNHIGAMSGAENHAQHVESVRLLVGWLVMTSKATNTIVHVLSGEQLASIAETLALVMSWARLEYPSVEQACLTSALEFSNGNLLACHQFARDDLLKSLFDVVEDHYDRLARHKPENDAVEDDSDRLAGHKAENDTVDAIKQGSALLALGCLIHLMEHNPVCRKMTLEKRGDKENAVDMLVKFFKQHVDQTDEVTSEKAEMLLGTFGWTALLLCAVCLDSSIREYIALNLDGAGIASLIEKAEKFLSPFEIKDADFIERFSTIIDTLKGNLSQSGDPSSKNGLRRGA